MSDDESNKTSEEILKELFHSLNLPVSPCMDKLLPSESENTNSKKSSKKRKKSHSHSQSENSPKHKKNSKHGAKKFTRQRSRSRTHSHSKSRSRSHSKSKKNSSSSSKFSSSKYSKDRSRSKSKHRRSRSISKYKRSHSRSRSRRRNRSNSHSTSKHRYSRSRSRYRQSYSHSRSRSRDGRRSHRGNERKIDKNKDKPSYSSGSSDDYHNSKNRRKMRSHSKSPRKKSRSSSPPKKSIDPLDIWKQTKLAELNSTRPDGSTVDMTAHVLQVLSKSLGADSNASKQQCSSQADVCKNESSSLDIKNDENSSNTLAKDKSAPLTENASCFIRNVGGLGEVGFNNVSCEGASYKKAENDEKTRIISLPNDELNDEPEVSKSKSQPSTEDADEKTLKGINDKSKDQEKSKFIIIKSLKDSQVFQQAQEEAKKKLKDENEAVSSNSSKKENVFEEGEILSEDETEHHVKSRAKKKSASKHKDKRHDHEKEKKSKHSSHKHQRSRSQSRHRHRSRSRSYEKKSHRKEKKRRSKSPEKRRSSSPDCVDSLRDKATRKRLLDIARRNAVYLMRNNCLPPSIEKESMKATGKSVQELTNFCKQLVTKGDYSDPDLSPSLSEEEGDETPFSGGRHPFAIKDSKPILMNIRNAPMLPTKTNAERLADTSKLREQFPVSSGSQHRTKESEWVPVEKEQKEKKEPVPVFEEPNPELDISQVVSNRVSAMRKLQDNPNDRDAIIALSNAQHEMESWVLSKQVPGQFTGTTGARVLSQEELSSGYQAWARKEQFKEAAPISSHFGLKMMQKMGWTPGEGLGKHKEGQLEPLLLDVKLDKKGLQARQEIAAPKKPPIPLAKRLSGKHPVSALVELCGKNKWNVPEFQMVFDGGPDHKKNFLMKVIVNNEEYKPSTAAPTKKLAKANAAAACLQSLGVIPKEQIIQSPSGPTLLQTIQNASGPTPTQPGPQVGFIFPPFPTGPKTAFNQRPLS